MGLGMGLGSGSLPDVGFLIGFPIWGKLLVKVMDQHIIGMVCRTWLTELRLALAHMWCRGNGLMSSSSKVSNILIILLWNRLCLHPERWYTSGCHPRRWYTNGIHPRICIPAGIQRSGCTRWVWVYKMVHQEAR
jgi:hypothetical protein